MRSTFLSLHYHLVFSTKNRMPLIDASWRERLHEYMARTVESLGGFPQGTGGVADHVHLLVGLKATHRLSDVLRDLKKASSMWVHREIAFPNFAWQEGYAAFSVSATIRDLVQGYIAQQESHHQKISFREELLELLDRAEIDYDPNDITDESIYV